MCINLYYIYETIYSLNYVIQSFIGEMSGRTGLNRVVPDWSKISGKPCPPSLQSAESVIFAAKFGFCCAGWLTAGWAVWATEAAAYSAITPHRTQHALPAVVVNVDISPPIIRHKQFFSRSWHFSEKYSNHNGWCWCQWWSFGLRRGGKYRAGSCCYGLKIWCWL